MNSFVFCETIKVSITTEEVSVSFPLCTQYELTSKMGAIEPHFLRLIYIYDCPYPSAPTVSSMNDVAIAIKGISLNLSVLFNAYGHSLHYKR